MERLADLIKKYGRWNPLSEYIRRIQIFSTDFSLVIENSKSLLESIAKEICKEKDITISKTDSIQKLIKTAFNAIGYDINNCTLQIASALSTIGQQIGQLRNNIGITSHGKTMEEIKKRNQAMDELSLKFLISSVELIAVFLIEIFEVENPRVHTTTSRIDYNEEEEFNNFWDEEFGEFRIGDYSYTASEILYHVDYKAYETELNAYKEQTNAQS